MEVNASRVGSWARRFRPHVGLSGYPFSPCSSGTTTCPIKHPDSERLEPASPWALDTEVCVDAR